MTSVYTTGVDDRGQTLKASTVGEMTEGLFALLQFLRHEFERTLEHADMHLEGIDDLDEQAREVGMEVGQALLEALEFTRGYMLDAFVGLGRIRTACTALPTPGGTRTVAVLVLEPAPLARGALGLDDGERVLFDGVYAYREDRRGERSLWMEIGENPRPASGRLPVLD